MKQHRRPTENMSEILSQHGVRTPSAIFLEAVNEGSNRERDWLWYAEQMPGEGERRYCWERALYINPESRLAQRHLARLQKRAVRPAIMFSLRRIFRVRHASDSVSPSLS